MSSRYSRFRLIPWWDQELLERSRVMVVGAGAIGNEVLKNLALLGVGHVVIVDFDTVENVNLSRSVLFREEDIGQPKAEVAARRLKDINPKIKIQVMAGNIAADVGLGVFRNMDVVIGALDNREARLAVNRACWKVGTPWVDGAISVLDGVVKVFLPPEPPCYECTMTDRDYEIIHERRSCQLMRPDTSFAAVPTTPTSASIVAGIQVQETLKILHKRSELPPQGGKGLIFQGTTLETLKVAYTPRAECPSHNTMEKIISINEKSSKLTLRHLLNIARKDLGRKAVVDFDREIVYQLCSPSADYVSTPFIPVQKLTRKEALCPYTQEIMDASFIHGIVGDEDFLDRTLAETGLPPYDILTARVGIDQFLHYEIAGDAEEALKGFSENPKG